jgi:hypothetical protein
MQAEIAEMILGTRVLNGTTNDTIVLTDEPMSGRGLLTTDVISLINATEISIVSMMVRVLVALDLLSTDKVTTALPGTMMNGQQLLVPRITNNHPLRMVKTTGGCHHRPSLLL